MPNKLVRWLVYTGLSIVISPIIVFNSGLLLVGDYAGENGLVGFLGQVFGAALTGSLSAWVVLLGPVLLLLIWLSVYQAWQAIPPNDSQNS